MNESASAPAEEAAGQVPECLDEDDVRVLVHTGEAMAVLPT